ncbi:MAG: hypothetical protein V1874_09570 [Spirochaetota bacterium]
MNKLKFILIFFIQPMAVMFLLSAGGMGYAEEEINKLHLKWEPVQGAIEYQIEIQDASGKEALNVKTGDTELDFNLPPGDYRVRIGAVNKFNKVDTWSSWNPLKVKKIFVPVIYGLSKNKFISGTEEKDLQISGRDIEKDAAIYIKNKSASYQIRDFRYVNSSTINFDLDVSGIEAGDYDLVVINPGAPEAKSPEKVIVSGKPWISSTMARDAGAGISAGYSYTQLLSPWTDVYKQSLIGFNLLLTADSALIKSVSMIPVLNRTGVDIEMNYSSLVGKERAGIVRTDMSLIMLGGSIYFRIPVIGKSSVRLKAGGGIAVSDVKEDALYSASQNYRSTDFYYSAGINYNFPLGRLVFIEAGISYYHVLYSDKGMNSIKYSFGIGIIF